MKNLLMTIYKIMDFSKTNSIFYIFLLSKTDRSNSDGGFSGHSGIQRYTTSKYTNAIHAGLCTLTPTYDRPPRSTSSSSQPDYRVCYHNHDMEHEMIYNHKIIFGQFRTVFIQANI